MNNTINRIKKRADILTEFFIERYKKLEKENYHLKEESREWFERGKHHYLALREWEMPCEKVLEDIEHIEKDKRGVIIIIFKTHGIVGEFEPNHQFYHLSRNFLKSMRRKSSLRG